MNDRSEPKKDEFDTPWKRMIEGYFDDFIAFFMPHAHDAIEWSKGYVFLDKELSRIARESEIGDRHMDKLVRVWKKGGEEQWVLIHADIQGDRKEQFASRMYTYQYRAYYLKKMLVVGLAVLADESPLWRPMEFHQTLWGSEVIYRFNTVKLLDYQDRIEALENSDNPFAIVVLAHLQAKKTRTEWETRYRVKGQLIRTLYQRGFSKDRIIDLFGFIDWVLALPTEAEKRFWNELMRFEESQKMPYITSVERIGQEKGRALGRIEGRKEGKAEMLIELLQERFGLVPEPVQEQVTAAGLDDLNAWTRKIFTAESLQEVFR
ncbi:MAG: cytosolic protein [Magnetococcales bacterium]|nr:cytosolic protein [Magnetococcales bacterium]